MAMGNQYVQETLITEMAAFRCLSYDTQVLIMRHTNPSSVRKGNGSNVPFRDIYPFSYKALANTRSLHGERTQTTPWPAKR